MPQDVIFITLPSDVCCSKEELEQLARSLGDVSGKVRLRLWSRLETCHHARSGDLPTSVNTPPSTQTIIDVMNPGHMGANGFELTTFIHGGKMPSATEVLAGALQGATVVKAFNTIGVAHMADPMAHGKPMQMLYAGPKSAATEEVISRE
jgi:hypothetical protein